jgi:hypothetical protein
MKLYDEVPVVRWPVAEYKSDLQKNIEKSQQMCDEPLNAPERLSLHKYLGIGRYPQQRGFTLILGDN